MTRLTPQHGEAPGSITRVFTWDWKEQPDLGAILGAARDMPGPLVFWFCPETGSDQYALILSDRELNAEDAERILWETVEGLPVKAIELLPAPHEVAVARLPALMALLVPGFGGLGPEEWARYVAVPGLKLGWGAATSTWLNPAGITRYRHRRDRAVWQQAARMLRAVDGEAVVLYVVHEQRDEHGKPVWTAVRIREEEEAGR